MKSETIVAQIEKNATRLSTPDDLDLLVEAAGDARYVLLGEASHGTSDFYTWRAELSKRLIAEKGFTFIAVEGDWPSCYSLNRYIKNQPDADPTPRAAMQAFNRWPTWMWANAEIIELSKWMREFNSKRSPEQKTGFYGLDVYSLWESMEEVIRYLERTGSPELAQAKRAFECFEPFKRNEQSYGLSASFFSQSCEDEVVQLLMNLHNNRNFGMQDAEAALSAEINALVAVNAERYYRAMIQSGPDSWNIRDLHMVETLQRLTKFHGPYTKAIIWEHNTHIGDARATDMARAGMINIGQVLREQNREEDVFTIGFGTHRGTVIAGRSWGAPMEEMPVPPAEKNSWEDLMHRAGSFDKILMLGPGNPYFQSVIGHRAIGVVYHPEDERGNYVPSRMAQRYDAFVYIDETKALDPLVLEVVHA
ncbi:protein-L-isoaspartate O-methyltransferase [Tumebacillus avium]|uniref:Protein-L-isoaspartate O-methyltransferase n=1 Tax=Tumebacillus avium TaxID=1903704 RepID=A0A1Y0ISG7_9BACL|nr:erythromycin esterase family protein [Tumebacillus avium]ARU62313.1 protein-L-isoaspartate O-methyltransferase [Tumebacillus avium]